MPLLLLLLACELPEENGFVVDNVEPMPPLMTAAEFRAHHGIAQYVAPPPVTGDPQEEQPTQKDIFEDLKFEDGPQLELKRDIPWKEDAED